VNAQPAPPLVFLHPGWPFVLLLGALIGMGLVVRVLLVRRFSLQSYHKVTGRFEEALLTALFLTIVLLSCLQLVLRNFFHSGLIWIDPLLRNIVLWLAFLGALTAASRGRHIAIDIFPRLIPRAAIWLHRGAAAVAVVACLTLANGAYEYLRQEYQFGREALLGLRTWELQSVLLFGFVLLAYRFVVYLLWGVREHPEGAL
jgi:C4-dicarboxylate transporter, DctQ subunit